MCFLTSLLYILLLPTAILISYFILFVVFNVDDTNGYVIIAGYIFIILVGILLGKYIVLPLDYYYCAPPNPLSE